MGVSLTGIMDNNLLYPQMYVNQKWLAATLQSLRDYAIRTNKTYAERIKIPPATAITCVKPSGTVSQLVDCSSGIHPRYSKFYIRRVRGNAKDPITVALQDAGIPNEVANANTNEIIFSFPISSPSKARVVDKLSAIKQLEHWKIFAENWCEHKPSVSIYVRENEWLAVGAWVYENWDITNGVSFFPSDDHAYVQAPYEKINEREYNKLVKLMPDFNLDEIQEDDDTTTSSQELACVGGACDL